MSDSDDYITAGPSGPASSAAPLVSHARTSEEALPTSSRLASAMSDSVEDDYITAGPSGPPASSVAPRAPPLLSGGTSGEALPPSSRVAGKLPPPVVTEDGSGDYIEVDNVLAGRAPSVTAAAGAVSSDYVAPKDICPAQPTAANPQADTAHPHTVDGPKMPTAGSKSQEFPPELAGWLLASVDGRDPVVWWCQLRCGSFGSFCAFSEPGRRVPELKAPLSSIAKIDLSVATLTLTHDEGCDTFTAESPSVARVWHVSCARG
jgi:hypothetical protein